MKVIKSQIPIRVESLAFFNRAKQYHNAASKLSPIDESIEAPLYFLYAHTLELLFKSYLNLYKPYSRKIHSLKMLFKEVSLNGLKLKNETKSFIDTLESENEEHGFRYFLFKSTIKPSISYVIEMVNYVMAKIEKIIKKSDAEPSKGFVLKTISDKPKKK